MNVKSKCFCRFAVTLNCKTTKISNFENLSLAILFYSFPYSDAILRRKKLQNYFTTQSQGKSKKILHFGDYITLSCVFVIITFC
jgi:hypothetical protein